MGNEQRLGVALEQILLRMRYIVRLLFHISSMASPHEIFNSMNTCDDASFYSLISRAMHASACL